MSASDALNEPQFAKHRHPLGGSGGVEQNLRYRADYETRHPNYAPQHQMDEGAAMALFNHQTRQTHVYTPSHWEGQRGRPGFEKLWD